jgi:hypothetical protein
MLVFSKHCKLNHVGNLARFNHVSQCVVPFLIGSHLIHCSNHSVIGIQLCQNVLPLVFQFVWVESGSLWIVCLRLRS